MGGADDEHEKRVRLNEIDVERAQLQFQHARDVCRFGTRRIVANAREEIRKLRHDRDEALLRVRHERVHLEHSKAVRDAGYEK